jgi:hypothetical protein
MPFAPVDSRTGRCNVGETVDETTSESREITRVEHAGRRFDGVNALSDVSPRSWSV